MRGFDERCEVWRCVEMRLKCGWVKVEVKGRVMVEVDAKVNKQDLLVTGQ